MAKLEKIWAQVSPEKLEFGGLEKGKVKSGQKLDKFPSEHWIFNKKNHSSLYINEPNLIPFQDLYV